MKLSETKFFFLSSTIFVSICVVALCQSSAIILDVDVSSILPFVFFATFFSYNFLRLIRYANKKNEILRMFHQKAIGWVLLLSFCFTVYFSMELSKQSLLLLLPAILITLLYPLKWAIKNRFISLREIPTLKIFLIAFVWSLVTVGLVAVEHNILFTGEVIGLFLTRFFFVLAITIPFDIRDLKLDHPAMKTIPQRYGVPQAKLISFTSLAIFEVFVFAQFIVFDLHYSLLVALLLTSLCSAILIYKTNDSRTDFYYSFWMEGMSILMYSLLFFIPMAFGIFVR